jgi:parallel beta-helix repeat protein
MFLMALAVGVTPVAYLDGAAHQSTTAVSDTRRREMLAAGTPHGPIAIDGDSNFSATALLEGWHGDGSPENPYIIDGLNIDLGGEEDYCIRIYNATVSFIIRNCNLTGASGENSWQGGVGIYLENVANGVLVNNTCNNNGYGICLSSSNYNTMEDNTCNNNTGNGIDLLESDSNTVMNNNCNNNRYGIGLWYSDTNTVANNTCNSNGGSGISLYYGESNKVSYNICNFNNDHGIVIGYSDSNVVVNNTCNKNRIGTYIYGPGSNILANNICLGNTTHILEWEFDDETEEFVIIDPVVLLVVGLAGIIMLGAGWGMVKLSMADVSEIWIGG